MAKALVIAEKPSVGRDIAKALGCTERKNGYIEGKDYIVTWAVGHLIGLKEPDENDPVLKEWRFESLPFMFPIDNALKVLPDTKDQFDVVKKLIQGKETDRVINAGDSGREGYLIQKWIYRMAGNKKPEKVLWLSSFTEEAILDGFDNLHEDYEFKNLLQEAESRAQLDWMFGMNYSRALTLRQESRGAVLSYGRCQTPLTNIIYLRDKQIENFVPVPYFVAKAVFTAEEGEYEGTLVGEDRKNINFAKKEDAQRALLEAEKHTPKIISYKTAQKKQAAPLLYDLGDLQTDAGKKFGYSADKTLEIAQSLYETHKILSYPRTDSKYLSTALLKEIHKNLAKCAFGEFAPFVNKIKANNWQIGKEYCNDKKITDHPALIPTITNIEAEYAKLNADEKNVFDLVVRRFLSAFYPPYIYQVSEILTQAGEYTFKTNGRIPLSKGYKEVASVIPEDKKPEDKELPPVQEQEEVAFKETSISDEKTKPPVKITEGNIIKMMEKYGIGTPATRASIIQRIVKRRFVVREKGKYSITPLGKALIESVPEDLKRPELTQDIEKQLELIGNGEMTRQEFLDKALEDVRAHIRDFEKMTIKGSYFKSNEKKPVGECPLCGGDVRKISPKDKDKKPFYGCMGYKEGCRFSMSSELFGKKFTDSEVKKILPQLKNGGVTEKIGPFVSKKGTEYEAPLQWDAENNRLKLVFEQKK